MDFISKLLHLAPGADKSPALNQSGKGLRTPVEKSSVVDCVRSPTTKNLEKSVSKQTVSSDSCSFNSAVESKEAESDTDATATADYDSAGENEFVLAQDSTIQAENLNLTLLADNLSGLHIATPQSSANSPHNCSLFTVKFTKTDEDLEDCGSEATSCLVNSFKSDDSEPEDAESLSGILNLSQTSVEEITITGITPFELISVAKNFDKTQLSDINELSTGSSPSLIAHGDGDGSLNSTPSKSNDSSSHSIEEQPLANNNSSSLNVSEEAVLSSYSSKISPSAVDSDSVTPRLIPENKNLGEFHSQKDQGERDDHSENTKKSSEKFGANQTLNQTRGVIQVFETNAELTGSESVTLPGTVKLNDNNLHLPVDSSESLEEISITSCEERQLIPVIKQDCVEYIDVDDLVQQCIDIYDQQREVRETVDRALDLSQTSASSEKPLEPRYSDTAVLVTSQDSNPEINNEEIPVLRQSDSSNPEEGDELKKPDSPGKRSLTNELTVTITDDLTETVISDLLAKVSIDRSVKESTSQSQAEQQSSNSSFFQSVCIDNTLESSTSDVVEKCTDEITTVHSNSSNCYRELDVTVDLEKSVQSPIKVQFLDSSVVEKDSICLNNTEKPLDHSVVQSPKTVQALKNEFKSVNNTVESLNDSVLQSPKTFQALQNKSKFVDKTVESLNVSVEQSPNNPQSLDHTFLQSPKNVEAVQNDLVCLNNIVKSLNHSIVETNLENCLIDVHRDLSNDRVTPLEGTPVALDSTQEIFSAVDCKETLPVVESFHNVEEIIQEKGFTLDAEEHSFVEKPEEIAAVVESLEASNHSIRSSSPIISTKSAFFQETEDQTKEASVALEAEELSLESKLDERQETTPIALEHLQKLHQEPENISNENSVELGTVDTVLPGVDAELNVSDFKPALNSNIPACSPLASEHSTTSPVIKKLSFQESNYSENPAKETSKFDSSSTLIDESLPLLDAVNVSFQLISEGKLVNATDSGLKSSALLEEKFSLRASSENSNESDDVHAVTEDLVYPVKLEGSSVKIVENCVNPASLDISVGEAPKKDLEDNSRAVLEDTVSQQLTCKTAPIGGSVEIECVLREGVESSHSFAINATSEEKNKLNNSLSREVEDSIAHQSDEKTVCENLEIKSETAAVEEANLEEAYNRLSIEIYDNLFKDGSPLKVKYSKSPEKNITVKNACLVEDSVVKSEVFPEVESSKSLEKNLSANNTCVVEDSVVKTEVLPQSPEINSSVNNTCLLEYSVTKSVILSELESSKSPEQNFVVNNSCLVEDSVAKSEVLPEVESFKSPVKNFAVNNTLVEDSIAKSEVFPEVESSESPEKNLAFNNTCLVEDFKPQSEILFSTSGERDLVKETVDGQELNSSCPPEATESKLETLSVASFEKKPIKESFHGIELNFDDSLTEEAINLSREILSNTEEEMTSNYTVDMDNRVPSPAKSFASKLNKSSLESNGVGIDGEEMDLNKTLDKQSESPTFDSTANRSEAGPVTAEEFSVPGSDFQFDFDSLSCVGRNSRLAASRGLTRNSLYVKFDPIVGKILASTEDSPAHLPHPSQRLQEYSLEKTPMKNPTLDDKLISLTPCSIADARDANTSGSTELDSSNNSPFNNTVENANLNKTDPDITKCVRNLSLESASKPTPSSSTPQPAKLQTPKNTPRGTLVSQEIYFKEVETLQELMSKQEQVYQEELNRNAEKMEKLQIEVSQLKKEIHSKTKAISQSNVVLGEYERTISQLLAQNEEEKKQFELLKEKLIQERDTVTIHLNNTEIAFNDVHQKYERSKTVIEEMKNVQDTLKASNQNYESMIKAQEEKYNKLRSHVAGQLEKANHEMELMRRTNQAENEKLKAKLKRAEITMKSLEDSLEQKAKENVELAQICDELIGKVGSDCV